MNRVVLGLSGGMDSATLCAFYLNKGFEVFPVSFNYGSKHNQFELEMAEKLAQYYKLKIERINLDFINSLFKSNLLISGGKIPEGYYTDQNMSETVVPGRNLIFISIMMGYAWSINARLVAIGVHSGDHTIYPDCRPDFINHMNSAVQTGSGYKVKIEAPFIDLDKTQILELGTQIQVPYNLTRTCYKNQEYSCGKCGSCQERLEAFNTLGIDDPIKYDNNIEASND